MAKALNKNRLDRMQDYYRSLPSPGAGRQVAEKNLWRPAAQSTGSRA